MAFFRRRCAAVMAAVLAASCVHKTPVIEKASVTEPKPEIAIGGSVALAVDSAKEQVQQKEGSDLQFEKAVSQLPANTAVPAKALSIEDIEFYLKNKVSSKLIAQRILERGVSFVLNNKTRMRLKKAKADSTVFKAIKDVSTKSRK